MNEISTTGSADAAVMDRSGDLDASERQSKSSELIYRPPMDMFEFDDRYELRFDLPGATPASIDVTIKGGLLSVEARVPWRYSESFEPMLAEYGVGDYRRRVRLGEDVDSERLTARYIDGVLELTLPKRAERRAQRIPISAE